MQKKQSDVCVQNIEKVEVILVNDGSRDESLSLCREYLKYNNFVLIDQKNKGLSFARNVGLKMLEVNMLFLLMQMIYWLLIFLLLLTNI